MSVMTGILRPLAPAPGAMRFNRREIAGAFGDIGTDLPLITGMLLVSNLDAASVLIVFGICQLAAAWHYGMPMPVQPLKAVAALVIVQGIQAEVVAGAGLAIGALMLILTLTGLIDRLAALIPKAVIRGIQLGLGLKLGWLALGSYVPADGWPGVLLALACLLAMALLQGNRHLPPAMAAIALGIGYAVWLKVDPTAIAAGIGFTLPTPVVPGLADIWIGFLVLALPQVPLSLGNSIFATGQLAEQLYPERKVTVRRIGWTYSLNNLVAPLFGGVPVCHGCGGLAGHHAFGGRTGGSVVIYGFFYLILGLFFSGSFQAVVQIFPLPVLGVILLVESTVLMRLTRDVIPRRLEFATALGTGVIAFAMPQGFLIAMIVGTLFLFASRCLQPAPTTTEISPDVIT